MTACTHPRISAWCDQETGERVQLWSCSECSMKFYPADEVHPALDENERLRERLEKLERVASSGTVQNWLALPDETKALTFALLCEESSRWKLTEDENERLREDAERYRWLRGDSCPDHSIRWTQWDVRCWVAPFWSDDLRREGLDRSIDAARAAERGKE